MAVATGAHFQARKLMENGVPFPCLVDPDKRLYAELGLERVPAVEWLKPRTWGKYLRGAGRARQGRLSGDVFQAPGVAVLDPGRRIRYMHRGRTVGDYPRVGDVLEAVRETAR